jgi:hypothetical protein
MEWDSLSEDDRVARNGVCRECGAPNAQYVILCHGSLIAAGTACSRKAED